MTTGMFNFNLFVMKKFKIDENPKQIIVNFKESRVSDMSAIDVLNTITKKYSDAGKTVHLQNLSADCVRLLNKAEAVIEVNIIKDPEYLVAID